METKTVSVDNSGQKPKAASVVDQQRESKSVAEHIFISAYRLAVEQERDGQEDKETAQSSTD